MCLNEKQASVLFPNLTGEAGLDMMFYDDDPLFHKWCLIFLDINGIDQTYLMRPRLRKRDIRTINISLIIKIN